jgi:hypothetical protein
VGLPRRGSGRVGQYGPNERSSVEITDSQARDVAALMGDYSRCRLEETNLRPENGLPAIAWSGGHGSPTILIDEYGGATKLDQAGSMENIGMPAISKASRAPGGRSDWA